MLCKVLLMVRLAMDRIKGFLPTVLVVMAMTVCLAACGLHPALPASGETDAETAGELVAEGIGIDDLKTEMSTPGSTSTPTPAPTPTSTVTYTPSPTYTPTTVPSATPSSTATPSPSPSITATATLAPPPPPYPPLLRPPLPAWISGSSRGDCGRQN